MSSPGEYLLDQKADFGHCELDDLWPDGPRRKPTSEDRQFDGGAVRSADADGLDFMSMPLIGLIGVAKTAAEGGAKYGRFNYMKGMPVHVCLNHAMRHIVMYAAGDRSEPHLSHAAWNLMAAEQSAILHPMANVAHMPGPGYTITTPMEMHMDDEAPALAKRRRDPKFLASVGGWFLEHLPEIERILADRQLMEDGDGDDL